MRTRCRGLPRSSRAYRAGVRRRSDCRLNPDVRRAHASIHDMPGAPWCGRFPDWCIKRRAVSCRFPAAFVPLARAAAPPRRPAITPPLVRSLHANAVRGDAARATGRRRLEHGSGVRRFLGSNIFGMKLIGKQSGAALPLDETLPAPDAAPLRLDEWLPYQLFLPAQHVARVLAEFYGPRYGIGQPAWRILATIVDRPGTNARQIGAALGMDAVSVSRGIAQLVGAGFARRDAARNDCRYACVMATPAGRAAFDDIAAVCIAVERRLLDVLTPEERATLAAALPKIGRESERIAIVGWQRLLDGV
ncbi:transcriptional regulator, MarR family [Burkholderia mallei SAVP1]|nr:transcriptional regulator, MarR family [Burkholderia mallei SAVP1]